MQSSSIDDRPLNDHYKSDIRYTFQFCYWILKPIGIYSFIYKDANKFGKIVSVILILICCSVLQFVMVPFSYILFNEEELKAKIKYLGPVAFCFTSLFKYGYLGMKGSKLNRCIQHVQRDWKKLQNKDHRDIMVQYVIMSRKLIMLCAVLLYTGGLSYHVIMPLLSKEIDTNLTIRPLSYPSYETPLDIQQSPIYKVVYCMQCIYVLIIGNITMAAFSLTAIFITHASGQIKIQTSRLENLKMKGKMLETGFENCLAIIVKDHTEILRFTKNVEKTLRELFFVEVIVSTLLICLLQYYCMMEWQISDSVAISTYIILLSSFIFNIFIFCYVGELLLGQGSEIATASYEVEWYNLPGRKARDIVMLLAISKYPPKLTAGRVLVLSMNAFVAILKASLVYLNLLRTVTEL
ncbi:PREDICTED: odorant receptor 85b-like [Eufriesea mexicana]|uniref:odorant receptor 85b-like n=1 Tax=Eufriesea mexicana TaxID=516756 RepID=UPI00083C4507|nr:PREDICTED: odorant receptor 85b-like [Eufriesea mexicana]XP_017759708.1 PREDICTED: odorant receptor 85b-like [Eufriesea mexicana]